VPFLSPLPPTGSDSLDAPVLELPASEPAPENLLGEGFSSSSLASSLSYIAFILAS